jgi:hypothetical protein
MDEKEQQCNGDFLSSCWPPSPGKVAKWIDDWGTLPMAWRQAFAGANGLPDCGFPEENLPAVLKAPGQSLYEGCKLLRPEESERILEMTREIWVGVEHFLLTELRRRGLDAESVAQAGRVCWDQVKRASWSPAWPGEPWPECADLDVLTEADRGALVRAGAVLKGLQADLEII